MAQKSPRQFPRTDNKDVLVCDICMERYDDATRQPKFLSCHHSYCRGCLMQVAGERDTVECPSCREVTKLSPGGVAALQTNFYIGRLQDTLKQAGVERGRGCRKHAGQPLSFFCVTCSLLICRDCTVLDHRDTAGHVIQDVITADPEQRQRLRIRIQTATETFEEVKSHLGHLEIETQSLTTAREELQAKVTASWEQQAKLLEARKVQLLKEIADEYNARQAKLLQSAEVVGAKMKRMGKSLAFAEHLTRRGLLCDVISISSNLDQTSGDLTSLVASMELGKEDLQFDPTAGEADFQACVARLGRLYTGNTLPSQMRFDHESLIAGLKGSVSLVVLNSENQPVDKAGVDVTVTDESGTKLQRSINWSRDGQGTLTFTPQMSGEVHLQGTFRGQVMNEALTTVTVGSNDPVCQIGGPGAGHGLFSSPRAVAVDADRNVYVADTGNRVIQKLDSEGEFLCQFDIGPRESEKSTCDLVLSEDEKVIVCTETTVGNQNKPTSGNTVLYFGQDGVIQRKFSNKSMKCGLCITTNKHKEIIVSDYMRHCLYMYDSSGKFLRKIGHSSNFNHPAFICVTEEERIVITDTNTDHVHVFSREGTHLQKFGRSGSGKGELKQPFGVAADGQFLLVADSGNNRIQVFRRDGSFVSMIESLRNPLNQPRGIAVTPDGHVFVADRDNNCIKKYKYK